ncbi:MAG: hypothetical protein ACLTNE_15720 [Intestinimonas butyriciproducens]
MEQQNLCWSASAPTMLEQIVLRVTAAAILFDLASAAGTSLPA